MCKTSYRIKGSRLIIVEDGKKRILKINEISEVDISNNLIVVSTTDGKKAVPFACLDYPVYDDICDFANALDQESIDPSTPEEVTFDKFGTTSISACEISTGIIRTLVGCYEDGSWTWTNPITDGVVNISGYIEPTVGYDFLGICYGRDDSDNSISIKERPVIALDRYLNKNNEIVYFEKGTNPSNNSFNIENYTLMEGTDPSLGRRVVTPPSCYCVSLDYTAPVGGGAVTKTRAEILADAVAKAGLTAPAGKVFDLQCATVQAYSKATAVTDFTSQVETTTAGDFDVDVTCNAKVENVNPYGGKKKFGLSVEDLDCNGESDNLAPADLKVDIEELSAANIYACFTPVTA